MSHRPAAVAARGPGAIVQLLATLLLQPAEQASALGIPTAQEGAKSKSQPSRKQSPVLRPAFTSGFSIEKSDRALEAMQMLDSPWEEGV